MTFFLFFLSKRFLGRNKILKKKVIESAQYRPRYCALSERAHLRPKYCTVPILYKQVECLHPAYNNQLYTQLLYVCAGLYLICGCVGKIIDSF